MKEITIDWGDGNTPETISKTSFNHNYTAVSEDREITVSIYGSLTYLYFNEGDKPISIDFSRNENLISTWLDGEGGYNSTSLEVIGGKYLTNFRRDYGWGVKSTNFIDCKVLSYIDIWGGEMTALNFDECPELTYLQIDCGYIKSLDFSNNKKLITLKIYDSITSINLEGNTDITDFVFAYAQSLTDIRCVNVSSTVYDYFNTKFSDISNIGTLTTDNSLASEALRATAASKGWTVIIE